MRKRAILNEFAIVVAWTLTFLVALLPPLLALLIVSGFGIAFLSDDVWGWINWAVIGFLLYWFGQKWRLVMISRFKQRRWEYDRQWLEQLVDEHTEGKRDNTDRITYLFRKFEQEYDTGSEGIPSVLADTLRSARIALLLGPKYTMVEDLRAEIERERLQKERQGGLR